MQLQDHAKFTAMLSMHQVRHITVTKHQKIDLLTSSRKTPALSAPGSLVVLDPILPAP